MPTRRKRISAAKPLSVEKSKLLNATLHEPKREGMVGRRVTPACICKCQAKRKYFNKYIIKKSLKNHKEGKTVLKKHNNTQITTTQEFCFVSNRGPVITFPEDLMPFHMQKYTMIHASNKHRARSHLMEPGSPTPELKASTLRLRKFSSRLESQSRVKVGTWGHPRWRCF